MIRFNYFLKLFYQYGSVSADVEPCMCQYRSEIVLLFSRSVVSFTASVKLRGDLIRIKREVS